MSTNLWREVDEAPVTSMPDVGGRDPLPRQPALSRLRRLVVRLPVVLLLGDVLALTCSAAWTGEPVLVWALSIVALCTALGLGGMYRSRLQLLLIDDLPRLITSWLAASAVALVLQAALGDTNRSDWVFVLLSGVLLLVFRFLGYALARRLRSTGAVSHRTLILGTTDYGIRVAEVLNEHPEFGLRPEGFLRHHQDADWGQPLPVMGRVHDLPEIIQRDDVGVVIVAYENMPDSELVPLVRSCHRLQCELFLIPRFTELHTVNSDTELIWGVPLVRLRRAAHRTVSWRFKRLLDIALSGTALLALAPAMAAIALAVRLEGGPGIIFRQTRVGIDGREFSLMKFRSMRPVDETESRTNWNIAHDDRLGPVGRFIRRSSLDELPQLINILRGQMSVVGPRPERPHFVAHFSSLYPSYQSRDRVPCGLTGWSQIHGLRGDTSIAMRAEFDNYYIENWSFWLDLKIILRTAVSIFKAPGA